MEFAMHGLLSRVIDRGRIFVTLLALLGLHCVFASLAFGQVPQISQPLVPSSVAPGSVAPNGPGLTLTVNGTGFVAGSTVLWNGSPRPTTFVSASRLTATITPEDVESQGTAWVTVKNPGVGAKSNVAYFEVTKSTSSVSFLKTDYGTGSQPRCIALGDFNGDGKIDLATANQYGNSVSVLLGNGDGTFRAAADYSVAYYPQSVAVGDFNGDGKLDLVTANRNTNDVAVLLGNGDGTFMPSANYAAGNNPSFVAVGDFNSDGKLDLAVANINGANLSVLLGAGDGTFQAAVNYTVGANPQSVVVGDLNADGILDLAVNNVGGGTVSVLLGNGDGSFQGSVSYVAGTSPSFLALADLNGDGGLDLVVTYTHDSVVGVILGNGDGTFQPPLYYPASSGFQPVVEDLNDDGRQDLVVPNINGSNLSLLLGNGGGTFQGAINFPGVDSPLGIAAGDFNGDGRIDLAVASYSANSISILLQPTPTNGLAQLNGGNTFTGDQTINGTVTATSFAGDGSGLTGVVASSAGTADFATNAGTAASAINALSLGGIPANKYARLDIGNNFSGSQNVLGDLSLTGNFSGTTGSFGGTLGIGTQTPANTFHVSQSKTWGSISDDIARFTNTTGDSNVSVQAVDGTWDAAFQLLRGTTRKWVLDSCGTRGCGFNAFSIIEDGHIHRFTIQEETGNVGIGTTNPSKRLDVAGDINASGNVTAASFSGASISGNGSGLTNLSPANLTGGIAGIDISGNAATATVAATSTNASALGGVTAANYARLDVGNIFAGDQTVNGNLNLSGSVNGALIVNQGSGNTTHGSGSVVGGGSGNSAFQTYAVVAGGSSNNATGLNSTVGGGDGNVASGPMADVPGGKENSAGGLASFAAGYHAKATNDGSFVWGDVSTGQDTGAFVSDSGPNQFVARAVGGFRLITGVDSKGNPDPSKTVTIAPNSGIITFVSGQTFPGTGNGTITGITAGTGLSGGGTSGGVSLAVDSTVARTNAPNTFNASQTVNGTLNATSLTGSGAGLTNLNPANLTAGTAAIDITGTAATAVNATNAGNLGGVAAGNYARLDIGNSFTGNETVAGNVSVSGNSATTGTVTIGSGGTPITQHISILVDPTFSALKPTACETADYSLTGAADGDTIALGIPNARMLGGGVLEYFGWVSAPDTITIRACNVDPNAKQRTAGSGAIRVDLWKH